MDYTRTNPSPRYAALTRMYRTMHNEGERFMGVPAEKTFSGISLLPQAARIKRLIRLTGALNILDYGSGKGKQYDARGVKVPGEGVHDSVQDYWDVDVIHCYDPSYEPFTRLPKGQFDGVISTDVLEHCPEEDIPWIVDEMFGYATRFVFANVACYAAKKRLPNGENAHCTVQPPAWWKVVFDKAADKKPDLIWEVWISSINPRSEGAELVDERIARGC